MPRRGSRDIAFKAVLLIGALAMGSAADIGVAALGVRLPPLFSLFWGGGAVVFILAISTRSKRAHAEELRRRRLEPRSRPDDDRAGDGSES